MARQAAPCTAVRPVPQGRGYPACRRLFGPRVRPVLRDRVRKGRVDRLKFEDNQEMRARLVALFTEARPASVTVLRMEVPCCRGIAAVCHEAAELCDISVRELVMGRNGELCQLKD